MEIGSRNESAQFLGTRYVGPPEACWRLFEFHMHDKSHVVERLAVHLEGQHSAPFVEGEEREGLVRADQRGTTLLGWFALNAADPAARAYRYAEIPEHYTWQKASGTWKPRVRRGVGEHVIGRVLARGRRGSRLRQLRRGVHPRAGRGGRDTLGAPRAAQIVCFSPFDRT